MVVVTPAENSKFSSPTAIPARDPGPAPWRKYVAIGDSFTEGLWDSSGADPDQPRGWADRLAEILGERADEPVEYANLAIRGKLLRPIIVDQVPAALALEPDLVSLIGGGNDMLRPNADPDRMARNLEAAVVRIQATGADVLLATGMDAADSPLVKMSRPRVAIMNSHIWSIAQQHGAYVLDVWGMHALKDWRLWADDRIHLTAEGHRRVAQGALVALGLKPDDPDWDAPLPSEARAARIERLKENAEWLQAYVYPWATRRLRGKSSGDSRTPKRPTLTPVTPPANARDTTI